MSSTLLRRARQHAGISQAELARRSGIAQSTISRIESEGLDPTWSTMHSLLGAAGWQIQSEPAAESDLISPDATARAISLHLRQGDSDAAARDLTEAVGRLIRFLRDNPERAVPLWALAPTALVLPPVWATFLATAFAYALQQNGRAIPDWMLDTPPLAHEAALADDPGPEFRDWLRTRTPALFREKRLLSRDEDWQIA